MKLSKLFSQITKKRALVVGDFLLDTYTVGGTSRISPEAPVPVVHVDEVSDRPGGAGNVALGLVSLGLDVVTLGRIGDDEPGCRLRRELEDEGIKTIGLFVEKGYATPIKNRVIASNQQIVRIDYERVAPISEGLEERIARDIPALFEGIDVVAISDYGKGFLSYELLQFLISQANSRGIPVIVDPKGVDFHKYAGALLIKPNLKEAAAAANLPLDADLDLVGQSVLTQSRCENLVITRSDKGISYFPENGTRQDFPVKIRQVKDVTGAGDTVLAVLTFSTAHQFGIPTGCRLANIAAGLAVEVLGCARITIQDLAKRLLEEDIENKVFDDDHLYALQEVLKDKGLTLLGLEEGTQLSPELLKTIRTLSVSNRDLMIYFRDGSPCEELIHLLTSLSDVNYIVHNHDSFRKLCQMIEPADVYVYGRKELKKLDQVSSLF